MVGGRGCVVFYTGAGDQLDGWVDLRAYSVGLQEFEGALLEFGHGGWRGRHGGWRVEVEGGGHEGVIAAVGVQQW